MTQNPRSVMDSSFYSFLVDHVFFSKSGDNKIKEQCTKFLFEIKHYYESFIEYWLYTLDGIRAELPSTSVV